MTEHGKLNVLAWFATALVAATLMYNVAGEQFVRTVLERIERKAYFEKTIAPKGLSLHEAEFWEAADKNHRGP